MQSTTTSVLIVGGSLVGLSVAAFLQRHGVSTLLVEKHAGSSPHPRAIGFTATTMEAYRTIGVAEKIPQAPPSFRLRRARVESLAGKRLDSSEWTPPETTARPEKAEEAIVYSPYTGAAIAQDRLEPLLRTAASALGADLRPETQLIDFTENADGVTANVRRRDGYEYTVRASYMIAADGNTSGVREALGIGRTGRGRIQTLRSVLFRAPLDEYLKEGIHQFTIEQPGFNAFLTTYADGRWVLMFQDDEERDHATLITAIHRAIGRSDLPIEIITTGRWELGALIADTFSSGRVFLAGDAAHTLPPSRGGFGANTGIADAYNLAWKIAAVLSGVSSAALLDTYDAERRPIAWLRHDQIFARPDYQAHANGTAKDVRILDDVAMEFGPLYRSSAVLGATEEMAAALRPEQWAGQPGTRAAHLPIEGAGPETSTLDLFAEGWTLLADGEGWAPAAKAASAELGVTVRCIAVGTDVRSPDRATFRAAFGLAVGGASLVRPDGVIAWRAVSAPSNPHSALTEALRQTACIPGAR